MSDDDSGCGAAEYLTHDPYLDFFALDFLNGRDYNVSHEL
jgi:hypothetical protein